MFIRITSPLMGPVPRLVTKSSLPFESIQSTFAPLESLPSYSHHVPESVQNEDIPEDHHTALLNSIHACPSLGLFKPSTAGLRIDTRAYSTSREYSMLNPNFKSVVNPKTAVYEPDFNTVRRENVDVKDGTDPRLLTYFMVGSTGVFSAMAAKSTVIDFLSSLSASGDTLAMAQTEVDLRTIPLGKNVVIKWRGKPVFIRHRTTDEIEDAQNVDLSELRDPQSDADRTKKPEWLVMLGVCTHLGCVPIGESGDYNGWYCPCQ